MGSSFFELNIAVSGLFAAQHGLGVTSNNITNAGTTGYSRQVLHQQASKALSGQSIGMIGTGVTATHIGRVRDSYLDMKLWNQNDKLGEYTVKTEQNALIEGVFGEPSDAGFTKVFTDLFKSIDDLSKIPTEGERKEAMRQMFKNFSKYFNSASQSLSEFQRDLNFEVRAKVDEINMLTTRIQSLNKEIYQAEMHGQAANTLRDDRELCVDRLSQLINVEAKEVQEPGPDGKLESHFVIKANGQTLVDHFFSRQLSVEVRKGQTEKPPKQNPEDINGLYDVKWADGTPFDMGDPNLSGELKGAIDMRDGRGSADFKWPNEAASSPQVTYNGIPYYKSRMDKFVEVFTQTMNETYSKIHSDEEGMNGVIQLNVTDAIAGGGGLAAGSNVYKKVNPDGTATYYTRNDATGKFTELALDAAAKAELEKKTEPQYKLFAYDKENPAVTFGLSKEIEESSGNIRTNYEHTIDFTKTPPEVNNPNPGNNNLLMDLLGHKDNEKMFKEGNPKDFMIAMFSELGINAKEATMYSKTQQNITGVIENQRLSVSQVDTNEEFMNLVRYNQAYQAAAKVINTMDGIYETLIMRLGSF